MRVFAADYLLAAGLGVIGFDSVLILAWWIADRKARRRRKDF